MRNKKRARIKGNESTLTIAEWAKKLYLSNGHCFYCEKHIGFKGLVLEHTIPIAKGGGTTLRNCVPSCGDCNKKRWQQGVYA
jgi:5-methylcytosine-specific restriction endonuclease McrA